MTMDATLFEKQDSNFEVKASRVTSGLVYFTITGEGGSVTLFTDNAWGAKALVHEMGKALEPLLKGG